MKRLDWVFLLKYIGELITLYLLGSILTILLPTAADFSKQDLAGFAIICMSMYELITLPVEWFMARQMRS